MPTKVGKPGVGNSNGTFLILFARPNEKGLKQAQQY
jgi:hypothetical protein